MTLRRLKNAARPWLGADAIGQIQWVAATEPVPDGFLRADGGGAQNLKPYPGLIAGGCLVPGAHSVEYQGSYPGWIGAPSASTSYTIMAMGRSFVHASDQIVYWAHRSDGILIVGQAFTVTTGDQNTTNDGGAPSFSSVGTLDAVNYCNGFNLIFCSGLKLLVASVITGSAGDYTQYTITARNTLKPIYFKGRYFSGAATALRRSDGPGSWATWANLVTTGRAGDFIDLVTDGETLAAFTNAGEVFISLDGDTFTKAAVAGLTASVGAGRAVQDGNGTWAVYALTDAKLYTSTDLLNWTDRGAPITGTVRVLSGGGGSLFVISNNSAAGAVANVSADGGSTWEAVATTTNAAEWNSLYRGVTGTWDGGTWIVLGEPAGGGFGGYQSRGFGGARLPFLPAQSRGGVAYNAYVRGR